MDYFKIYENLIESRRKLDRSRDDGNYYESHHIIPRCMGGKDGDENEVLLTFKEHFISHLLLMKIYPKEPGIIHAGWMMTNKKRNKINSKIYEMVRNERLKIISRNTKGKTYEELYGEERGKELRKSRSESNSKRKLSKETRKKIGDSKLGKPSWNSGITMSDFSREKLSESKTGIKVNNGRIYSITKPSGEKITFDYGLRRWWEEQFSNRDIPTPFKKINAGETKEVIQGKWKNWKCERIK